MKNVIAEKWLTRGSFRTINGYQLFVIDSATFHADSKNNKPTLCILHGFPTSSFDYWKVIDQLAEDYRVIIHDHLGFGFSDKPLNYTYSLVDQTDMALLLWQSLDIHSGIILAHDYGTSIATELLARDNLGFCPIKVERLVLCNGSMHIELAQLRLMQRLLRNRFVGPLLAKLSNRNTLKRNFQAIYVDKAALPNSEMDALWSIITHNHGKKVLAKISRYTFERIALWHRWIGALQQTQLPIEIIWPDKDPIAVAKMAEVIANETQNSQLHWLENVGHFPMLEAPDRWGRLVLKALESC